MHMVLFRIVGVIARGVTKISKGRHDAAGVLFLRTFNFFEQPFEAFLSTTKTKTSKRLEFGIIKDY